MFGGSLFRNGYREFDEDPFFSGQRQHMEAMNRMMMNPYAQLAIQPGAIQPGAIQPGAIQPGAIQPGTIQPGAIQPGAIQSPEAAGQQRDRDYQMRGQRRPGDEMAMYGGDIFSNMHQMMGSMMGNMHQQMAAARSDPNAQYFSSSTMMSYSSDGSGQPKVYQASSSTTQAPGGIRETKRSVRDSSRGVEKMAVGRQIGDRMHTVTKQRDRRGDIEENHDYNNLDEDEAEDFHREFRQRAQPYSHHRPHHQQQQAGGRRGDPSRRHTPAIEPRPRQ